MRGPRGASESAPAAKLESDQKPRRFGTGPGVPTRAIPRLNVESEVSARAAWNALSGAAAAATGAAAGRAGLARAASGARRAALVSGRKAKAPRVKASDGFALR